MLLSAQRVRSAQGLTGINLYVYRHDAGAWDPSNLEALEQGAELVDQAFEVPPGGNTVTRFLDVFASNLTRADAIARAAAAVRAGPPCVTAASVGGGGRLPGVLARWSRQATGAGRSPSACRPSGSERGGHRRRLAAGPPRHF